MKQKPTIIALSKITGKKPFLSGNTYGKEIFRELLREVDAHPATRVFEISLKGITATDASFPRESAVSLIKMYSGEKAFYLTGFATPDLMDNWDYAAKAKNQAVIVIHDDPREYDVVGPSLSAGTKDLLDYVMREGVVTTSKVAKKFDVSPQNASAKMKKLHSLGLVLGTKETAESGGLEFVYQAIRPI